MSDPGYDFRTRVPRRSDSLAGRTQGPAQHRTPCCVPILTQFPDLYSREVLNIGHNAIAVGPCVPTSSHSRRKSPTFDPFNHTGLNAYPQQLPALQPAPLTRHTIFQLPVNLQSILLKITYYTILLHCFLELASHLISSVLINTNFFFT